MARSLGVTALLHARQFLETHRRWSVVALLFLVAVVNNLDRQALSVLAPTLRGELGFTSIEYSYVVTSFLAAYTLGYAFCGTVLDRIGVKLGLAVALGFWSSAAGLHAAAMGWISLAVLRFLLGLGESFNSPAAVKAVAEWIPPRERGLSMAIASNGNVVGAMLAPPLVSLLALQFGWRWAFLGTGSLGLLLLAAWWKFYHSRAAHPKLTGEEKRLLDAQMPLPVGPSLRTPLWKLFAQPICLGFFFARFLTDSLVFFFSFWLPDYLAHARSFTLAMIGLVGWLPFLAADIGGPGGGAWSDWLVRRGWASRRARLVLMGFAAAVMPLANLAVQVNSASIALGLIAVLLAAQSCWMANQLTLISETVAPQNVGSLLAISAIGGSLGGMLSTLGAGRVITEFGYGPVFAAISVLHPIAFCILLVCFRREPAALRGEL